ncbi:hyalin-like [Diadema antillarum]|uniref:hyalin-like n=1 Tax=Diadema antillarum TaxID=105358 RepID=UPI003A8A4CD4
MRKSSTLDTTPPVIDGCPSNIAIEAVNGASDVSVTWIEPTATDDSGSVSLTQTAIPGDIFPLGSTEVTYTFSDPSGNSATCSFSVVVSVASGDTISPVITGCPSDINLDLPSDFLSSVSVSWTEPTATDDSGFVSSTSTHQPGDIFDVGSQTTVTYTFSDSAGNTAICSFDVIVSSATPLDTTPPVIDGCPSGIAIEAASGASDVSVTWVEPTATDDSGSVSLTQTAIPGDIFPLGSTVVTYTFSDPSGNSATCSFSVVVSVASGDTISPVITGCPSDINLDLPSDFLSSVSVSWTEPTATDDSGFVSSTSTHQPGDIFDVGSQTTVVYTFSDSAGNTAICAFDVIVSSGMSF